MNHERGPRDRGQGASVGGAHPSLTRWSLFDTSLASAALLILNSLSNRIQFATVSPAEKSSPFFNSWQSPQLWLAYTSDPTSCQVRKWTFMAHEARKAEREAWPLC